MKKLLVIVLPLLLIVGCSKPINDETLIEKDGLKYHPDTKELYSGKVFNNYMGGKKEFEGTLKGGKKDGLWTQWYENGQKSSEETFKDGEKDGLVIKWYNNGQKFVENTYKDGKIIDGEYTLWYKSGRKWLENTYKDGKLDGLSTYWDRKEQLDTKRTYKDGELISQKCWDEDRNECECSDLGRGCK